MNCESAPKLDAESHPPRAATSRMMSYFSIFRTTNLPASAGSYSVFEITTANAPNSSACVITWGLMAAIVELIERRSQRV